MRSSRAPAVGLLFLLLSGLLLLRPYFTPFPDRARTFETGPRDTIEGLVSGSDGPLSGARVRLQATSLSGRTDEHGRFRLPSGAGTGRVTAWKEGYLIGQARTDVRPFRLTLERLPSHDDPNYQWVDPSPREGSAGACANCHAEIYREWSRSGHARSASGRHFRNLYEGTNWEGEVGVGWGLVNEHPDGIGVCASCHAPAIPERDEARFDLRQLHGVAVKGVHCDYCHKIAGVEGEAVGLTHGQFDLRLLRPKQGQLFFGPLDDVVSDKDSYSPLYHQSRYCASCHEGVVFGVPVYTTYSEWLASPARRQGKQCQDCHMVPTGKMTNFAPGHGGLERKPDTLANHRFYDGSPLEMLRRCLDVTVSGHGHGKEARAIVRMRAEGVGHRVPTGYIDRHLLLTVEGRGPDGEILTPRSGPVLPPAAGRELAGRPGRLYAKLYRDFEGGVPAPFWRPGPDPLDNRLTPGEPNEMVFVFPRGLSRLRVRVLYRRFWKDVERKKGWPDRDLLVLDRSFAFEAERVRPTAIQGVPPSAPGANSRAAVP